MEDKLHPCKIMNNDPKSKIGNSINEVLNNGISKMDTMQYIKSYLADHGKFIQELFSNMCQCVVIYCFIFHAKSLRTF